MSAVRNPIDLIDIGVNLTNKQFRGDVDAVIARALDAGVSAMVATGTNVPQSEAARALAQRHPGVVYSTAGVHPHDAKSCDDTTLDALRALAATPQVVAIGECGLDYNRDFSPRPVQRQWFEAQVALAAELEMPLFLHCRDAHDDFAAILRGHRGPAVIHCFTGSAAELEACLELGLSIGITGWICDERRGGELREIVSRVPLDQLMVETDAPFLLPRDLKPRPKSRRNEPRYLPHITKTVAHCIGADVAEIAAVTSRNARRFFGLSNQSN